MTLKRINRETKFPIWLRRLWLVKEGLKGLEWPSERESYRLGIQLMALGLAALKGSSRDRMLERFSIADDKWKNRWKKERVKIFGKQKSPLKHKAKRFGNE